MLNLSSLRTMVKSLKGVTKSDCDLRAKKGTRIFKKMYICFSIMMKRFKVSYYRVFGPDSCFLRGPKKGKILSTIRRNANNQMYLVTWVILWNENKDNWKWSIHILMKDLSIMYRNAYGYTIVTNQ